MFSGLIGIAVAKEVAATQLDAQKIADSYYTSGNSYTITYDISTRGTVKGDIEEFRKIVAETYTDPRGWSRAGVKLTEVESGGQMHVILSQAEMVEAAAPTVCSATLSCQFGQYVYINDTRWMNASDSYNALNVSLINYRRMVINHETGHFLGHRHIVSCETQAGLGPIMLQQSTGLKGCKPNPWPLPNELWVRSGL